MNEFLLWVTKIYRRPKIVLAVALVLTLVLATGIPFLKFDNNIRNMLPGQSRDLKVNDYYEDESRFGNSSFVFLGVESGDVFDKKTLSYIHLLQTKIEALNDTLPVQNVASLLALTPEEASKLVEGLKNLGINEVNFRQEMVPVVTSAPALKEKLGLDDALALKVAHAAARVDLAALYHRFEQPIHKIEDLINADSISDRDDSLVV